MAEQVEQVEEAERAEPVLSVRDLEVVYETDRGPLRAVDGTGFDLFAGESLALVGESGSGKTTLATALVRLLSSGASIRDGKILFRTQPGDVLDLRSLGKEPLRRFRWQECALVFQGAQNALDPVLRVRDHFEETQDAHRQAGGRVSRRELAAGFEEVLRLVQLTPAGCSPRTPTNSPVGCCNGSCWHWACCCARGC